jgi:hypothetical protein
LVAALLFGQGGLEAGDLIVGRAQLFAGVDQAGLDPIQLQLPLFDGPGFSLDDPLEFGLPIFQGLFRPKGARALPAG